MKWLEYIFLYYLGIPQVPVRLLQDSKITAQASDIVMASLKNHQSVVILKCASSNPKTRLLYLSQLILNDASERNVKLKVVTTIKAGRQPKEYAEFLSNERKESITLTFGYQDKLESQVSPCSVFVSKTISYGWYTDFKRLLRKTFIQFQTVCHNEILLRSLMGNDSILTCMTHIIIDGVDDNDRFCDLLLLVGIISRVGWIIFELGRGSKQRKNNFCDEFFVLFLF